MPDSPEECHGKCLRVRRAAPEGPQQVTPFSPDIVLHLPLPFVFMLVVGNCGILSNNQRRKIPWVPPPPLPVFSYPPWKMGLILFTPRPWRSSQCSEEEESRQSQKKRQVELHSSTLLFSLTRNESVSPERRQRATIVSKQPLAIGKVVPVSSQQARIPWVRERQDLGGQS